MRMNRSIISANVLVLACLAVATIQAQRPGVAGAAGSGQNVSPTGAAGGGGQRGGGQADAPTIGPGNLVTGVWGSDPLPVDSRGWGWMTKSYVSANYKGPFYNKAKELLFSGKQV